MSTSTKLSASQKGPACRQADLAPILIIIILAAAALGGYLIYQQQIKPKSVACTMDAKICPDGSAVGRVGPNCDFAPCPTPSPTPQPNEGEFCGGIAGIPCSSGYKCVLDGNYPDAGGKCVKE